MSEQGQAPPPPEPETPKQNDPRAAQPVPDQATTPLPADAPAAPGQQQPAAEHPVTPGPQPTPEHPVTPGPQSTAEHPAAPAPQSTSEHPAAAPIPPAAPVAGPGRVRRFAGHRATQLVAVGLLGLVLGGGIVGAVAANRLDHSGPGHIRMYDRGERGPGPAPGRAPDRGGDRFDQRGPFNDRGDRFER
jgi:hypothetical protein